MSGETSGPRGFEPSAAMLKYARACLEASAGDPEARCALAGVSVRALARWQRGPAFGEWLRGAVHRQLSGDVWEIWVALRRQAREGSRQAAIDGLTA